MHVKCKKKAQSENIQKLNTAKDSENTNPEKLYETLQFRII